MYSGHVAVGNAPNVDVPSVEPVPQRIQWMTSQQDIGLSVYRDIQSRQSSQRINSWTLDAREGACFMPAMSSKANNLKQYMQPSCRRRIFTMARMTYTGLAEIHRYWLTEVDHLHYYVIVHENLERWRESNNFHETAVPSLEMKRWHKVIVWLWHPTAEHFCGQAKYWTNAEEWKPENENRWGR